jgi:hypothetical protein
MDALSYSSEPQGPTAQAGGVPRLVCMTTPRKSPSSGRSAAPVAKRRSAQPARELQPQATGADRGSPTAPVMKQFAKTKSESSGRS